MRVINRFIEKYGSQQKAADRLGVSQTAVWKWTTGESNPSLRYARIIAEDMGETLDGVYSEEIKEA